ncbi:restriction endonuclease [Kitasatospora sp. CB02891]|uniref:restriction endonuclease n=1 Tax=Kitasatospora sp. CB02891 TaxID=2020329 RepID=UPI000CA76139|nr:restriction endonuclease [Kitasatospora sp. CB02891]PJN25475.1 restriction endonuclease [Kitasatospora sp. CB02891]
MSDDAVKVVLWILALGAAVVVLKAAWAWAAAHLLFLGIGLGGIALLVAVAVAVTTGLVGRVGPYAGPGHAVVAAEWSAGYTLDDFAGSSPTGFEEMCRALLDRDGFSGALRVGGAGDLGADVIAYDEDGRKVVAQCKRYSRPVGSREVQTFNGTARPVHRAEVAVMVGLSGFTGPARTFARQQGIHLVDEAALERWGAGEHLYEVLGIAAAAA